MLINEEKIISEIKNQGLLTGAVDRAFTNLHEYKIKGIKIDDILLILSIMSLVVLGVTLIKETKQLKRRKN